MEQPWTSIIKSVAEQRGLQFVSFQLDQSSVDTTKYPDQRSLGQNEPTVTRVVNAPFVIATKSSKREVEPTKPQIYALYQFTQNHHTSYLLLGPI